MEMSWELIDSTRYGTYAGSRSTIQVIAGGWTSPPMNEKYGRFQKIGGKPPKWMVKIMENPIKNGWFGGYFNFWKHPYMQFSGIPGGKFKKLFATTTWTYSPHHLDL